MSNHWPSFPRAVYRGEPVPPEQLALYQRCLDWLIPLHQRHLRQILITWVAHYNRGRPHSSLGPGIPDPQLNLVVDQAGSHRIPPGHRVVATPILGGLHHEYRLEAEAA
jgi:transposase InsO family protein